MESSRTLPERGIEGAGDVLAKLDNLAVVQLRMEALLDGVKRDLCALAAQLGNHSCRERAEPPAVGRAETPGSVPDVDAMYSGQSAGPLAQQTRSSRSFASWDSSGGGFPEVPPSLPYRWPASVLARQDLSSGSVRVPRTPSPVRREDTQKTAEHLVDEFAGSVREGTGVSRHMMVDPNSNLHSIYSLLTLLVLTQDLVLIPYALAWDVPLEGWVLVTAWISCCFWTVDIVMSCITGFQQHGHLELRLAVVLRRYAKSWLLPDVAIVGTDWLGLLSASSAPEGHSASGIRLLRFAKAGKLLRLVGLFRMMKAFKIVEEFIENSLSDAARMTLRCFLIVCGMLWVNHLFGCAWYFVGRTAPTDTGMRWIETSRSWKGTDLAFLEFDGLHQYITSLHWSVAQFTLGSIDVAAYNSMERIFNIFCLSLGLIFGSTLVSILSAGMVDYQMTRNDQIQRLRMLRRFLRENNISSRIVALVQQQARERLSLRAKLQEEDVGALQLISRKLRTSLRYELFKCHLHALPLFRIWTEMDFDMVRELCVDAMNSNLVRSQDDLFSAGASTGKAYCLVSGHMSYFQEPLTAPVFHSYTQPVEVGQWMCEAALWTHWIHVGTAKTRSLCQVVSISGDAMAEIARKHPAVHEVCAEYCAVFHRRIVSATPPHGQFPTDLEVPSTDFTQMVVSMDLDVRVKISMTVLESLLERKHASVPPPSCLRKLRDEVSIGECDLMIGATGQLERVVSVEVIRIESSGGRVLAELGSSQEGPSHVHARCQLPAEKRQAGEESDSSVARLLAKFDLRLDSVDVARTERTAVRTNSKEVRVITQYLRTVHHVLLRRDLELPVLFAPDECKNLSPEDGADVRRTMTVAIQSELLQAPVYKVTNGGTSTFYSWLEPTQLEHFSTPAGEEELSVVLTVLGDRELAAIAI